MKRFLILTLLLAAPAFAQESGEASDPALDPQVTGDVVQPTYLKDAQIDVKLKDGKSYGFGANEYKVVTRESSRRVQKLINSLRAQIAKCENDLKACEEKVAALEKANADQATEIGSLKDQLAKPVASMDPLPNRITFHLGVGPDGVATSKDETGQKVKARMSPVWGLTYARQVHEAWSAAGTLLLGTSQESRTMTLLAGAGYDF